MMSNNFFTSLDILNAGERDFFDTMTPIIGETHAMRTFENAQIQAAATQIAFERTRDYLGTPSMHVLPEGIVDLSEDDETT